MNSRQNQIEHPGRSSRKKKRMIHVISVASFLFFVIILTVLNVTPVMASGSSSDSNLFEPFTEEEDYVFDEEYWSMRRVIFYPIPRTVEEETEVFNNNKGTKYAYISEGPYLCSPISREEQTAALTCYNQARGDIVIPEEVDEYQITRIGLSEEEYQEYIHDDYGDYRPYQEVFFPSSCDSVTSVILPEGIKTIGYYSFDHCRALRSIQMPDSLEEIYPAFRWCESLQELTIPAGVRHLELNVPNLKTIRFEGGCPEIEEIRLSDTISEVELKAPFAGSMRLIVTNRECSLILPSDYTPEAFADLTIEVPVGSELDEILDTYGIYHTPISRDVFLVTEEYVQGQSSERVRAFDYSVEKGDTLCGISRRYRCTVEDLVRVNEIANPNLIYIGQELWIPVTE